MRCRRNGVEVLETTESGDGYRVWQADLWECPECHERVIGGFGGRPIMERHEDGFAAREAEVRREGFTINGRVRALVEE
jgi:hypothetical protein